MNRNFFRRSAPFLFFASFMLGGFWLGNAETGGPVEYRVTDAAGEAGFLPHGGSRISPVVKNLTLEPGDRLITGKTGRIELATKAGTVMELKENSNLRLDGVSAELSRFFLRMGKLLGKFAPAAQTQHRYNINTPVAVAAVRGTELAMNVQENGETDAGVVEGEVAFGPSETVPVSGGSKSENAAPPLEEEKPPSYETEAPIEKADWKGGEVVVKESKGISVKPREKPAQLSELPPIAVAELSWFPKIRERIPQLREQWKDLTPPSKQELRQQALRKRIQWKVLENMSRQLPSPHERMKDRNSPPEKLAPKHLDPEHPHSNSRDKSP